MPQESEINSTSFSQEPAADVTGEAWGDSLPPVGGFPEFEVIQEQMKYRNFGHAINIVVGIWE